MTKALSDKLEKVISELHKQDHIIAIYLFGSYAVGCNRPNSDVDIAVLLKTVKDSYLEERLELMAKVADIMRTDNLDLVILNDAPYGLAYRIIKDGSLLYLNDEARSQYIYYKTRIIDRYFDYQPVQRLFSAALSKRIKGGNFGGR